MIYRYFYLLGADPVKFFGEEEAAKKGHHDYVCTGVGANSIIATLLVGAILSKSQYDKVIQICEAGNDAFSAYAKMVLYFQIILASLLTLMTFAFMSMNPAPESCLANMAALLILNDFDNIVGYVFELRIKKQYPKL